VKTSVAVAIITAAATVMAAIVGVIPTCVWSSSCTSPPVLPPGNVTFVDKFGNYGSGDKQFNEPNGIAINGQGHIYISDKINNRI
jgi:tripartite motif-containing protein 71